MLIFSLFRAVVFLNEHSNTLPKDKELKRGANQLFNIEKDDRFKPFVSQAAKYDNRELKSQSPGLPCLHYVLKPERKRADEMLLVEAKVPGLVKLVSSYHQIEALKTIYISWDL